MAYTTRAIGAFVVCVLTACAIAIVFLSAHAGAAYNIPCTIAGPNQVRGGAMEQANRPVGQTPEVSRRTLRLTFKSSAKGLELISVEHLPMITPPQPGERPEAGKHGGQWLELRNGESGVLAHRLIDQSLFNSVEVHSPDGKIRREFGPPRDITFEVLLPDVDGARFAVLMGEPFAPPKPGEKQTDATRARSGELQRFDLSQVRK